MKKYAVGCFALVCATSASAQVVYTNNFDSGGYFLAPGVSDSFTGLTNGATESAVVDASINATGWAGNYWANRSTGNPANVSVLELTNLPAHTTVTLEFLLGFLESWDSVNGNPAPDLLDVTINGVPLLSALTSDNASGNVENYAGGSELFDGAQINTLQSFSDTLLGYNLTFGHTSSTLSIGFGAYGAGWQGGTDEGFGLDAFRITLGANGEQAVPEPATWAMMLLGFGAVGWQLRRRRRGLALA